MSNLPSGVAAANVMSGQRTATTITFPLTGDAELDAISGILMLLKELTIGPDAAMRIANFVFERNRAALESWRKQAEEMDRIQKQARPGIGSGTGLPMPSGTPYPSPWTTSGGTAGQLVHPDIAPFYSSGSLGPSGMDSGSSAGAGRETLPPDSD
jgi:hypothetical protein